jgi:glycosyltransferase involved in cell wall biosynthesis
MPVQAEAIVNGLRAEGVDAVPIAINLGHSGLFRGLDNMRFFRTFLRAPVFLFRLIRALPRVTVLHINVCSGIYFFLFGATSILLGRMSGRRIVLHYHSGNAPGFLRKRGRLVRSALLDRVDHIVVPSDYLQAVFADIGYKSTIVPNVCDLERFRKTPLPLSPVFVVARNLEPVYGIDTILQAFVPVLERFPHAKLMILGSGSQARALQRLAAELRIDGAVTFTGSVENSRIPELFASAAIFVNASVSDNQPVAILEAFAAGLPVITSDVGGIPCLVRNRETGLLVPPRNPDALTSAMFEMLDKPELAARCTAQARRFVRQYSWPVIFSRLRDLYGFGNSRTMSDLCRPGYSDLGMHLQHDHDTAAGVLDKLNRFKRTLREKHTLLRPNPVTSVLEYALIHGNWALNNSDRGTHCGLLSDPDHTCQAI